MLLRKAFENEVERGYIFINSDDDGESRHCFLAYNKWRV
jgi:hypothetical protein